MEEDSASPRGGATEEGDCGEDGSLRIGVWEILKKKDREKKKTMKEFMVSEKKKKRVVRWLVDAFDRIQRARFLIFHFSFFIFHFSSYY